MQIHQAFDDIDELCLSLRAWNVEMHPLASGRKGTLAGEFVQIGIEGGLFGYAGFNNPLKMMGSPPMGMITFNLMEATPQPYRCRGKLLDSEKVWVFPHDGELSSISPPGFQVYTLSLTEDRVACIAAQHGIDLPPPSRRQEVFSLAENTSGYIRRHLRQLSLIWLNHRDEVLNEILSMLVVSWLEQKTRDRPVRPSLRARARAIKISLELIEQSDPGSLTTDRLLNECHVSERTLQYAFREQFGSSPAAVIKSLRLSTARAALRKATPGTNTVASIASRFGFSHLPQFATDYRKMFGELPRVTLSRLE